MTSKKVLVGLGIMAAAAIGFYAAFHWSTISSDNTSGTIGAAKKYRAEQIADADVVLQDPEVQELIQSDTFYQLITDAQFRKSVTQQFNKVSVEMTALNRALLETSEETAKASKKVAVPIDLVYRTGDKLELPAVQEALRSGDPKAMEEANKSSKIAIADLEALRQGIKHLSPEAQNQAIQNYSDFARLKIKNQDILGRADISQVLGRVGDKVRMQAVQEALRTGDKVKMDEASRQAQIPVEDLEALRQGIKHLSPEAQNQAINDFGELSRLKVKHQDIFGRVDISQVLGRVGDKVRMQAVQEALRTGDKVKMDETSRQAQIPVEDLEALRQGIKHLSPEAQNQAIQAYGDFARLNIKHKELFGHGVTQEAMSRSGVAIQTEVSRNFFSALDQLNRGGALSNPKVREGLARNYPSEAGKNATNVKAQDLEEVARVLRRTSPEFQDHFIKSGLGRVGEHIADVRFQDVMATAAFGKTLQYEGLILKQAVAATNAEAGRSGLAEMKRIDVK